VTGQQQDGPAPSGERTVPLFLAVVVLVAIILSDAISDAARLSVWASMAVSGVTVAVVYLAAAGLRWGYRRAQREMRQRQ
jgi:hypothetical protein